jgi:predicted membrane protein (TIGR00267 family)
MNRIELRDIILGGQDGLVNVLGLSLGLFAAGTGARIIIIAALAAGLSEAVSMGAVAYTSGLADKNRLAIIVERGVSAGRARTRLIVSSFIVGISALVGALLPIIPFFFLAENTSIYLALIISAGVLFGFGVWKAKSVGGSAWKSGLQILTIGLVSAFAGFLIGFLLRA